MESRTVQTRSGDMAYVDAGQGRVALFVHGVGTSSYFWRNVIAALDTEPDRRCVAIDLPMHGASPTREDYSLPALAEAIEDFCDALGLTGIDLVANDTGGAIAQVFAARHSERLRTFTLTNCDAHDNMPPEQFKGVVEMAERGKLAPQLLAGDPVANARASIGEGYEQPEALSDETLRTYIEPITRTPELAHEFERFLVALRAADLMDAEPALTKLEVPTLVAWGTADEFFPLKWAYWLRDTIPGVTEVVEIEGAKLFFPDERPNDLVPHLRRHWTTH
jgi:pimeloyl-ACP methyl ester carboxylesterase